jgi:3-oxoacyl-[acyl-carrier-protein] synthase III
LKIDSIGVAIPSLKVTNEDIVSFIKENNWGTDREILEVYIRLTRSLLAKAGSRERYFRNKEKKESALNLIIQAMNGAFVKSAVGKEDIDLLIYCGVGKGFLEPANAYFFAEALGMECSCYDIVDACMSWVRALEVAYSFIQSGRYMNIMIINGEFNIYDHGFPELFRINDVRQIEYTFPAYTIGEAASATILTPSPHEWSFQFKSVPELCSLCTMPLKGYKDYINGHKNIGHHGPDLFVSYGALLFHNANKYLVKLLKDTVKDFDEPDIYFPHAASDSAYIDATRSFIKFEKMYALVFPTYGNLVSASIPVGMCMAEREGRLQRGNRVVFCPASAGMVFGVVQFTY